MPLEGHFEKVNTPVRKLTRRERGVAIAMLVTSAVAILVLLVAPTNNPPTVAQGCIRVPVPGRTGGEVVTGCGSEAIALCTRATRFDGLRAELVVSECRERGIDFASAAGS